MKRSLLSLFFFITGALLLFPSPVQAPQLPTGKAPLELLIDGFRGPTGIAVSPEGTLFFTDEKEGSLFQRDPDGTLTLLMNNLKKPRGLARSGDGTLFFLADELRDHQEEPPPKGLLLKLSPDGTLTLLASGFKKPQQLILEQDGHLLLSTTGGLRLSPAPEEDEEKEEDPPGFPGTLFRVDQAGQIVRSHPGFRRPSGLWIIAEGPITVAAEGFKTDGPLLQGSLFRIDPAGQVTLFLPERFKRPTGLVQDALEQFYLAVKGERREEDKDGEDEGPPEGGLILKVAPDGSFTRFAEGFERPWGLTLDPDGNLYVTDPKAGRIYRFLAPKPPTLTAIPAATNQPQVTLSGKGEAEARITVRGGKEEVNTLADSQGNFTLPVPLKLDQTNTLKVYATGVKGEGLTGAPATTAILQDSSPPAVAFLAPSAGQRLTGILTVEITASDSFSGIATVEFLVDGILQGSRSASPFTFLLDTARFAPGPHTLTARAFDKAGNSASLSITVDFGILPPTLAKFEPTSGKVGTAATLTGTNFDPNPSGNTITFNGILAEVLAATSTQLFTKVPEGATTGPIAVKTAGGTATSTGHFIVLPSPDFTLTAGPSTATVIQGNRVSYAISIEGREGFTGLASLAVTGLPTGATGAFTPAALSPGQVGTLTVQTAPTTGLGLHPLTITGSSLIDGVAVGRQQVVNLSVQAAGVTALTGRVLDTDGNPVQGVTLTLAGRTARSDAAGNFLLQDVPAGADQFLFIDGSTAVPDRKFPTFPALVTIVAGQVNALPFTPFLHPQKATGFVDISNSGVERRVTDPTIPDFELMIPAGVTITGWDGQPNTKVSVRTVPLDKIPLPHPDPPIAARSVYFFYFDKVGGGTPSQPVPVTAANDLGLPPGAKAELWYYDEGPTPGSATNRWRKAGTGTVSADGKTITTDPGVGLPRFCCGAACFACATGQCNPPQNPRRDSSSQSGEPVDLNSGVFVFTKIDMVIPGRLPPTVTRTYRTLDTSSGVFGIGWSGNFDIALRQSGDQITLVLPGNTGVPFTRQPDGSFLPLSDPGHRGSKITLATDGSATLRLKDGTRWTFPPFIIGFSQLQSIVDRNGNTVTISRDSIGRATAITDSAGRRITFEYAASIGPVSRITDPLNRTVQYEYDPQGRLVKVTDPNGGVTQYTYDSQHRMLTLTDPRNITFLTNTFGSSGRVVKQVQVDGGEWRFAYTLSGATVTGPGCPGPSCPEVESLEKIQQGFTFTGGFVLATTVTDPRGNTTTHRFNNFGDPIEQSDALGQATKFERAEVSNLLLSVTDPLGRKTRFTYDASGNVTSITDPAGNVRSFEYEPTFNRLTKLTDPLGNVTQFAYDPNGNLTAITDPLGNVTQITYNQFGQPVSTTDPLGNVTTFAYDTVGNLISIADPLGNTTQRSYDLVSRLVTQIDPRGKRTNFSYDTLNRITQIVDALNGVTRFSYDENGNLLAVIDALNHTTTHTYDSMDRLATRTDPLNRSESFVYDPNGNLTQFTDRKGQISTFTYDALNRRTRSQFADGTFTEFTYDAAGRLININDSVSGGIANTYDILDRLVGQTKPQGSLAYTYDVLSRRTSLVANGEAPITYTYDAKSQLTQVTQGTLTAIFEYDAAGRRTQLSRTGGIVTTHIYDAASRLTNITHQVGATILQSLAYTYDAAGNRISLTGQPTLLPDPVPSATYDAANQQLTFGTKSLSYDADGNLVSITDPTGTTTLTWDARNRLSSLGGPGVTASFIYDGLGRRIHKVIDGQLTSYLYDGFDVVQELSGGAVIASYLRSLNIDEALFRISATSNAAYLTDGLGSTTILTDIATTAITNYVYEPFGRTAVMGIPSGNPFQFTGRENDGTGLYYYRDRHFSPLLGRFISEDPLIPADATNRYAYVRNNPVKSIDPLGLIAFGFGVEGNVAVVTGIEVSLDYVFDLQGNTGVLVTFATTIGLQATTGGGAGGFVSTASTIFDLPGEVQGLGLNTPAFGFDITRNIDARTRTATSTNLDFRVGPTKGGGVFGLGGESVLLTGEEATQFLVSLKADRNRAKDILKKLLTETRFQTLGNRK